MDYQTKKILKYINKHKTIPLSLSQLHSIFPKIDRDYLIEIIDWLNQNNYIKYVGSSSIKPTNIGKTYFNNSYLSWVKNNVLAIIAIVISIIALFV